MTLQGDFPVDAFLSVWVWDSEIQNCGICLVSVLLFF